MKINLNQKLSKKEVFKLVMQYLQLGGYQISELDEKRPWGGFFKIDEKDTDKFIKEFFYEDLSNALVPGVKLCPKILLVEPGKRLSWQYHKRRSEIWKVLQGPVEIVTSESDNHSDEKLLIEGDVIHIAKEERHRLIGLKYWGVIAEIWQHTDINHLSDEEDIVRVKDDFGRD